MSPTSRSKLARQFRAFHQQNPYVYDELVKMCWQAKAAGRNRIGIGMLFEVIRWNVIMRGLPAPGEDFKLNNNYRSRYARLIEHRVPELRGIFEKRRLHTGDA